MSGLQQASHPAFDSVMYLESMKFLPLARTGTVVANLVCARRWLLAANPRSGRAKSVTAPRNRIYRDQAARRSCTGETAIGLRGETRWLHYDKSHFTAKGASASRRPRKTPWRRW